MEMVETTDVCFHRGNCHLRFLIRRKTLDRNLKEAKTVEVLLKMAEFLFELRQLLAQYEWKKRFEAFVSKTETGEVATECLTGTLTHFQIMSWCKNTAELPKSG